MPFRSLIGKCVAAATLALLWACGGDGTGPAAPIPTTVTITSPAIELTELGQTATVTATVTDQNGAAISNPPLTFSSSDPSVASVSAAGVVTATGDGTATITVSSGDASATTTATVTISILTLGQPLAGLSLVEGAERLFTVDVGPGSTAGRVLEFATEGDNGDADIFVRLGAAPAAPDGFDCLSISGSSNEACAFAGAESGRWFVLLQAFRTFTDLTITPRLVDVTAVTDGTPAGGLSAGANSFTYLTVEVPLGVVAPPGVNEVVVGDRFARKEGLALESVGSANVPSRRPAPDQGGRAERGMRAGPEMSTPATLTVSLAGGSGDADLFGRPGTVWGRPFEGDPAGRPECASERVGNAESCVIEAPAGGTWIFALFGAEPFDGVTFEAEYRAGVVPDPGTITIRKRVTAFDGGVADNPANPSLAGFEFEVREAGGGALVTTVETDASGTAIATVPAGTWDITESDARGLTDVTGAERGVVVSEATDTEVEWENRQADPNAGTITIRKAVTSSTGGTADNPSNPSLAGFVFEVLPTGGGPVVATLTTDTTGVAVASVSPGSYDIVEADALGLTDATGPVNGVVVTAFANTNVTWENRQRPNQAPTVTTFFGPSAIRAGDRTIVYFNAGNSTDPDGDSLTYAWSSVTGTFLGGTTGPFTRVGFTGPTATVRLTVDDGRGGVATESYTVTAAPPLPPAGTFRIELITESTPSQAVRNALEAAVDRWEGVVRSELADIDFGAGQTPEAGICEGKTIGGTIDDVRIYVNVLPIDGPGGTLGRAGPCFTRVSDGTSIVGAIEFDSGDLADLSQAVLDGVVLHEMAHVLGFGTLWRSGSFGLLENPSCPGQSCTSSSPSPDTRYIGTQGANAWLALGGRPADGGAPVENGADVSAGPGTRDGHWRESVFADEVMTGFITTSSNPVSYLTIASLADIGLARLDFSQADDFVVPSPVPLESAYGTGWIHADDHDDIAGGPIYVVDEAGRVVDVVEDTLPHAHMGTTAPHSHPGGEPSHTHRAAGHTHDDIPDP